MSASIPATSPLTDNPEWIAIVKNHVENLRFGVVQLVIHDGRVTQIERTEKVRLPADREARTQS
jgi:hypothetical protein